MNPATVAMFVVGCFGMAGQVVVPAPPATVREPAPQIEERAEQALNPARRSSMMDESLASRLRAEEDKIKLRRETIRQELGSLNRAAMKDTDWAKQWAGEYYEGDGLGTNVTIHLAPKGGIAFLNYGCMGLYGGDHGEVVEALPDGLRLKLVFGSRYNSFLSERMHFVRWGEERFLVPDWLLPEMVNNYNRGGFARAEVYGIPRLRRDDQRGRWHAAPPGRPELPEPFAKMLMDQPVNLKVTRVSTPETRAMMPTVMTAGCTVEFEGGTDKGIYVGMKFRYPKSLQGPSGELRITGVTEKSCTGELRYFYSGGDKLKFPALGELVSTFDEEITAGRADDASDPKVKKEPGK